MITFAWIVGISVVILILADFWRSANAPDYVCTACHSINRGTSILPGSGWVTFVLLLCWVLPGVIYWVWRHASPRHLCRECHRETLIPVNTPVGQAISMGKFDHD